MNTYIYYLIMLLSVTIASFSQILLKKSAMKKYSSFIKEYLNPYVIVGYGMLFGSMVLTIIAYSGVEFKIVPVMESVGYIIVMILSLLFFQEKITKKKAIGTMLILLGVIIFNR